MTDKGSLRCRISRLIAFRTGAQPMNRMPPVMSATLSMNGDEIVMAANHTPAAREIGHIADATAVDIQISGRRVGDLDEARATGVMSFHGYGLFHFL